MELNWNTKENKQFVDAILYLKNEDEAKRFLRDLLTPQEIEEFSKRLETARLLTEELSYSSIVKKTGLSSTTVARISKWLKGSLGGYRLILVRLAKHHHTLSSSGKGLSLHS